ncbi:hypothetical protein CYY_000607 [Polysphondylium violaceum]|uniref:Ubiquinone biosynthesis O-methyltransferase, mitochondrial n=1 Tax=Polysphondylium violaceum TaxID=133409 RepID=A0A8J4QAM7_9MYCE|nr:hypothetical protein CYY_000607 [Polysphondylium violaceum]
MQQSIKALSKLHRFTATTTAASSIKCWSHSQPLCRSFSSTNTTPNDNININNINSNNNTLKNEEIQFFNNLSKDWWNPEGTMKPLHRMNPLRVQYIVDSIKSSTSLISDNPIQYPLKGLKMIDIGCGAGLLSESLSRLGADKVIGLDAAKNNVLMAKSHASADIDLKENIETNKLEYVESTIERFIQDESMVESFDVVCSLEVIEHVDNPQEFLKLCTRLLKPGGHIFISTINKTPTSFLATILGAEYIFRMVPIGTHHWSQFIKPADIHSALAQNNCAVKDTQGLFYNPYDSSWSLIKDLSVNYILYAIKK